MLRESWLDIRRTIGLWPLGLVTAYALVAFLFFAWGVEDTGRALDSAVYSLLMLFVWLVLIALYTRTAAVQSDGLAISLDSLKPRRELALLLAILVFEALVTLWVWLIPGAYYWPLWVMALASSYALPMMFMRWRGYGPEHVGLHLHGNWKTYLLVIAAQMFLAQALLMALPYALWRRDLVAGLMAIVLLLGLVVILASPLLGARRISLAGVRNDLHGLAPFVGLLGLLAISQVVGSILLVGDAEVLTRPLFPLNGYFAQGPVSEELFYRGLLQTRLLAVLAILRPQSRSVGWAILVTGLAFTAMHIPSHLASGADIVVELFDFTGGLANAFAAGYIYHRTKNLVPVIIFHSLSFL